MINRPIRDEKQTFAEISKDVALLKPRVVQQDYPGYVSP